VTLSDDGRLVIYSRDPSQVNDNELLVALSTVHIPKNIVVAEPTEKLVRTKRNGPKREKVFAIRVAFKNHVLFTFGAATEDEAKKWKAALEGASHMIMAPDDLDISGEGGNLPKTETSSLEKARKGDRASMLPYGWRSEDENWHVVEVRDGLQIEGEKNSTERYPILRARAEVSGTPDQVFKLVMDDEHRQTWDEGIAMSKVLKVLNDQSSIVYLQTKEFWVGPIYSGPRDLVMLRYWRRDEDSGDIMITWQSVEDSKLAPEEKPFTRGKIFSMGINVSALSTGKSLIRISCHADPGGTLSYLPSSVIQGWLSPFVTRILGIQKALDDKTTRASAKLEKDAEDEDSRSFPRVPLSRAQSEGLDEKNAMKLGSWKHSEWIETPLEEQFRIRGKTYLTDRIKIPSGKHMFHIVAADLNKTREPVPHCAARSDSPLRKIQAAYPDRQVLVLQFIMPGPPFYILAVYGVSKPGVCEEDTPFSRLWNDFVEGTDEYRNTVFKMIPRVTKGAYIVKRTVGETPALLGQKIKLNYYTGPNYIEVDVDLNTSAVAGSILSIFKGYATTLTADLCLLLEGHSEEELPEEILMSFRMIKPVLGAAIPLGDDPDPEETKRLQDIVAKGRYGEVKKKEQGISG